MREVIRRSEMRTGQLFPALGRIVALATPGNDDYPLGRDILMWFARADCYNPVAAWFQPVRSDKHNENVR